MPGAPGKPGARDAGVLNYIDLALAGAYADQQDFYRRGLAALDAYCRKTYKQAVRELSRRQQDEVITALEQGKATGFTWPTAQAFFNTLRTHTMEGMFADPVYGGNKDFAGWRLVGFPGAQPHFTTADMQSKQAFTRAPMVGLQAPRARRGRAEAMATEKTDVVIVGVGAAGGILAAELGKAGMKVDRARARPAAQDRGFRARTTSCATSSARTCARTSSASRSPGGRTRMRAPSRSGSSNYGNQAGGGTVHYGAVSWRLHEDDFRVRSQHRSSATAPRPSRRIPRSSTGR